jgi:hypothetical protein
MVLSFIKSDRAMSDILKDRTLHPKLNGVVMTSRENAYPLSPKAAVRIHALPELTRFVEEVEATLGPGGPEAFWQCEPSFARLLNSDFLPSLVSHELGRIGDDSNYSPAGSISDFDLAILLEERFTLSVCVLEPGMELSKRLYSMTEHCMIGVAGSGMMSFDTFEQPVPTPNDVFDRSKRLERSGVQRVRPLQVQRFRAAADVFRMLPPVEPVVLLFFTSSTLLGLRWEYDASTLFPIRAIAASSTSSRLEYTARMLAALGDRGSICALASLLNHQDHFVRWTAIQSVMRLDFDEGVRLLEVAVDDPHPHVKGSAHRALDRLSIQGRINRPGIPKAPGRTQSAGRL